MQRVEKSIVSDKKALIQIQRAKVASNLTKNELYQAD
jgi:hypothetical protein